MFKWVWKIVLLGIVLLALYLFRFSIEDGELIIRLRSAEDREEIAEGAKEAAEKAKELAGKVHFEKDDAEKVKQGAKKVKKAVEKVKQLHEDLPEEDRKALEKVIEKELE